MKASTGFFLLALAASSACAPMSFGPAGWTPGAAGGLGFNLTRCGSTLGQSAEAARIGVMTSPTMRARAIQARIQRIQARASFGYGAAPSRESWKQVASGDC